MIVSELRAVLEHLPADLPVSIQTPHPSAQHITQVRRLSNWSGRRPCLVLSTRSHIPVPTDEPDPGFTLTGKFRRPDELLLRLDPDVPLGAPVQR